MLFYGDSAADKEIIHLSDHINTEKFVFRKDAKKHLQYQFILKKVL